MTTKRRKIGDNKALGRTVLNGSGTGLNGSGTVRERLGCLNGSRTGFERVG